MSLSCSISPSGFPMHLWKTPKTYVVGLSPELNFYPISMCFLQSLTPLSFPLFPLAQQYVQVSSHFSSVQFSSVAQSCLTLCDPMNRSMPGLPVHHQHPEFTQTHVHRVSDAIQPSRPRSSPSPPSPNPSQHQSLFQ